MINPTSGNARPTRPLPRQNDRTAAVVGESCLPTYPSRLKRQSRVAQNGEAPAGSCRGSHLLHPAHAARCYRHTYQKNYQRWQQLMDGRGKRSGDLLQKQWQSGDVSTTEYLLALQQRAEGLNAGIELQSQFQLSQIDWLLQVGQIKAATLQLSQL